MPFHWQAGKWRSTRSSSCRTTSHGFAGHLQLLAFATLSLMLLSETSAASFRRPAVAWAWVTRKLARRCRLMAVPGAIHLGRAVRLDDYMQQEDIAFAHVVAIDVEGWDGLVLHGLERVLSAQRVGVLQAELNGAMWTGLTRGLPFHETIEWLWALGYGCFAETKSGCILPVSDRCWQHYSEGCGGRFGGNIVCGQGPYLRELLSLAQGCRKCSFEQTSRPAGVRFSDLTARRAGRAKTAASEH